MWTCCRGEYSTAVERAFCLAAWTPTGRDMMRHLYGSHGILQRAINHLSTRLNRRRSSCVTSTGKELPDLRPIWPSSPRLPLELL